MQVTVISLLQPWASLVVMGAKKIETRSWNTEFRGELYIHASLGKKYGKLSCRELCYEDPFKQFIDGGLAYDKLPFGKIIGKVKMVGTIETEHTYNPAVQGCIKDGKCFYYTDQEISFGDYSENRFGWLLSNPVQFAYPIQAKGKQGFWNYELPNQFSYQTADGAHMSFSSPPTKEDGSSFGRQLTEEFTNLK